MKPEYLLSDIERIANLGSYETNLTTGKWKGSENFLRIFGLPSKEEYTVEEFQALVHPDDFEEVMTYFGKCLEEKKDFNYEYRCKTSSGSTIHIQSRSKVFYDDKGNPVKILGIKQDITERKLAELKISKLNELNQIKNDILGLVAHDLRNPIFQIQGTTSLLKEDIRKEHLDLLEIHDMALESLMSIVDDLIETAKLEESVSLKLSEADINPLIKKSLKRFRLQAEKKKILISTELADTAAALINPEKFSRIIDNLLSNAVKFCNPGDSIKVTTENRESDILLKVSDTGIGIPEEQLPNIFDKYSNEIRRTGTEGESSIGLGLNIVKHFVDLHGGSISAKSEDGNGSEFTVKFEKNN